MGGVFRQDQQTSRQGIPHVPIPRYVREDAVFNDLWRHRQKRDRRAPVSLSCFLPVEPVDERVGAYCRICCGSGREFAYIPQPILDDRALSVEHQQEVST